MTFVNVNWTAGGDGEDGVFALLLVTEDGLRHTVSVSPAAVSAVLTLIRDAPVLLWDPDAGVLIAANLVGEWLPLDWSGRRPDADGSTAGSVVDPAGTVARSGNGT